MRLTDKWGSEDGWLRALFARSNLIWLFRDEFTKLELGELRWLDAILNDAYLVADIQGQRSETNELAFVKSIELVKNNIEQRILAAGLDAELERLKVLIDRASSCEPLEGLFNILAKQTRAVYGTTSPRRAKLQLEGLIDHPLRSSRPGVYADPYHVNAQTRVDGNAATIVLQIHLDQFNVQSMLAIPALLTHELVCHAHAKEDRHDSRSIWAEGVMDWAALLFFEQWSWRLNLPYGVTNDHGRALWDRRMTTSRLTGRLAADSLAQWLTGERSIRGISVARRVTAQFALEVNASDASLRAKDTLASRLANVWIDKELQEAIRAWRNAGASVVGLLG
jgi:hypothetical protein